MATHPSILGRQIPWTEEPGGQESDRLSTQQRRSQHSARWGSFFSCVGREILAGSQFPGKDAGVAAPWLRVARGKGGGNWSSGCTSLEAPSAPPPVRSLPPLRRLRSRVFSPQLSPRECGRPHSRARKLCPLPALALRRRHTNEPLSLPHSLPSSASSSPGREEGSQPAPTLPQFSREKAGGREVSDRPGKWRAGRKDGLG